MSLAERAGGDGYDLGQPRAELPAFDTGWRTKLCWPARRISDGSSLRASSSSGRGRFRASDCVRQRSESSARARCGAPTRARRSHLRSVQRARRSFGSCSPKACCLDLLGGARSLLVAQWGLEYSPALSQVECRTRFFEPEQFGARFHRWRVRAHCARRAVSVRLARIAARYPARASRRRSTDRRRVAARPVAAFAR